MHDEAFADAARPAPRCLLRLPMRPYAIGHELLLTAARNPLVCLTLDDFAQLTISQQISAVINAAYVCSQTWKENQVIFHGFWDKIIVKRRWKRWEKAIKNTDWPVAIADFRNYRLEGSSAPPLTDERFSDSPSDEKGGRAYGSPFLARLINYLRQSRVPEDVLMDYPVGRAAFEYFAAMEEAQRAQVENWNEHETRLSFEKHKADIEREQSEEAAKV